jgi:(4-(4-[2-(gamma-L-glutamylamino)ethyl]phenoxymethyl)furan-2-yl)methanamine synthase
MHEPVEQWRCSSSSPEPAAVCGWDIGGAHLKVVGLGRDGSFLWAVQAATPLWQGLDPLQAAIRRCARWAEPDAMHGLTLTGEAADCFVDRPAGVLALLGLWQGEFPAARAWLQTGTEDPQPLEGLAPDVVAASGALNFLATGHLCARMGLSGVLADMGSSTTDLLVVWPDGVRPTALDDAGRLASGELVYQGMTRTPLLALGPRAPFEGRWSTLMNEHFATMADVHRLTGWLDETTDLHPAADGAEKTPRGSARRLGRMIGVDLDRTSIEAVQQLARWFALRQQREVSDALSLLASRHPAVLTQGIIATGIGARVLAAVARTLGVPCRRLAESLGAGPASAWIERCTPAWACARLLVPPVPGSLT